MSWPAYILIFGLLAAFGVSVVWALWWALRGGQFSNFAQGARSIFDEEEPEGFRTDAFPHERPDPPPESGGPPARDRSPARDG